MPHVDLKYDPNVLLESHLVNVVDQITEVVGRHFDEDPAFVSLEIVPQNTVCKNRKSLDLELDSSPDPDGLRVGAVEALSKELAELIGAHLESQGLRSVELSAWVRVFAAGHYQYHRTASNDQLA